MENILNYNMYDLVTFLGAASAVMMLLWSFFMFLFKLNSTTDSWIDNIAINDFNSLDDLENMQGVHPQLYYVRDESEYTSNILFSPKNVVITRIYLKKLKDYKSEKLTSNVNTKQKRYLKILHLHIHFAL